MKIDFNQALEQLAQAFNTSVDKLYPILIKQAFVSGVVSIIEFLASLIVVIIFYKMGAKAKKKYDEQDCRSDWEWFDEGLVYSILIGISSLILIGTFFLMTSNAPTAFLNPEYWAIEKLLSVLE